MLVNEQGGNPVIRRSTIEQETTLVVIQWPLLPGLLRQKHDVCVCVFLVIVHQVIEILVTSKTIISRAAAASLNNFIKISVNFDCNTFDLILHRKRGRIWIDLQGRFYGCLGIDFVPQVWIDIKREIIRGLSTPHNGSICHRRVDMTTKCIRSTYNCCCKSS